MLSRDLRIVVVEIQKHRCTFRMISHYSCVLRSFKEAFILESLVHSNKHMNN